MQNSFHEVLTKLATSHIVFTCNINTIKFEGTTTKRRLIWGVEAIEINVPFCDLFTFITSIDGDLLGHLITRNIPLGQDTVY